MEAIFNNDLKNSWWIFAIYYLNSAHRDEEELGSFEKQLTSNNPGVYTAYLEETEVSLLLFIQVYKMAKNT